VQVAQEELIELTNRRKDHHLVHCSSGDEVCLLGTVTAVSLPPSRVSLNGVATLDDGTGLVEFEIPRQKALGLLGALVEVKGVLLLEPQRVPRLLSPDWALILKQSRWR
jgi:hypothetical protein